jgi:hypothetical protein
MLHLQVPGASILLWEDFMAKIYVSSTILDLQACRKTVNDTLHKMNHQVIAMED